MTWVIYSNAVGRVISSHASSYAAARAGSALDPVADLATVGQYFGGTYELYESFVSFDTSVVSSVGSASFKLRPQSTASLGTHFTMELRDKDWGTSIDAGDWVAGADLGGLALRASRSTADFVNGTDIIFNDVALAASINMAGYSRYVVCSSRLTAGMQPTGNEYVSFDAEGATRPTLTIEPEAVGPAIRAWVVPSLLVGVVPAPAIAAWVVPALTIPVTAGPSSRTWVVPAPSVSWWVDVTAIKDFSFEVRQGAGEKGIVIITPRELFNPEVQEPRPGLVGPSYAGVFERPPITTVIVREATTTEREVTLTTVPPNATRYYRIDETDPWKTGPIPFILDVDAQARTVEYYSVVGAVQEPVRRLVIDRDSAPSITPLVLTEPAANVLRVVTGFDDRVVRWALWARRNGSPVDPVTNKPLGMHSKYDGGMQTTTREFRALGNGDSTSTWHVLVRAYDKAGAYVDQTASRLILGAASTTGELFNLATQVVTHSGTQYIDVTWSHNQIVENGGHTVTIRENMVEVVTGRSAKLEHDEASVVALLGGWHTPKNIVDPGTPGAVQQSFAYAIDLIRSSDSALLATYTANVTVWIAGGGGEWGSPPTETPANLICTSAIPRYAAADWTNTNIVASVRVEWQRYEASTSSWLVVQTYDVPAASISHGRSASAGDRLRFRVRYFNAGGTGPWAGPSNEVTVMGDGP